MARPTRPRDRFPDHDEPIYPPPIGDMSSGRPRARTMGDDAPPPYPGPVPRGTFPAEDIPRRSRYPDRHGAGVRPPVDDRRPEPRRPEYYPGPDPDRRPPRRAPTHRSPPPPDRGRYYDDVPSYEPSAPRRAKSVSGRRGPAPEPGPVRPHRYESPDPVPRRRRSPREAPREAPRDARYDRRRDGYDDRRDRVQDPRRVRTAQVSPYDSDNNGYRRQPGRRSSFDRADRGRPTQGRRQSPSPQAAPRPRHRSLPPKNMTGRLPAGMQNIAWQTVARTALTAGAQAAYKARKDPSPWMGEKGARVATAAIGAAIVDGFMGTKRPEKMGGKGHKGFQKAAGMAAERIAASQTGKRR